MCVYVCFFLCIVFELRSSARSHSHISFASRSGTKSAENRELRSQKDAGRNYKQLLGTLGNMSHKLVQSRPISIHVSILIIDWMKMVCPCDEKKKTKKRLLTSCTLTHRVEMQWNPVCLRCLCCLGEPRGTKRTKHITSVVIIASGGRVESGEERRECTMHGKSGTTFPNEK